MCKLYLNFFFFKQKTAYEMRISDWSSDVCSSDLCWRAATCWSRRSTCRSRRCSIPSVRRCAYSKRWRADRCCRSASCARPGCGRAQGALLQVHSGLSLVRQPLAPQIRILDAERVRIELRILAGFPLCRSEEHTSELQSLMRISYAV